MDEQTLRAFFRRISTKLALLLGGTVAFSNSSPLVASPTLPVPSENTSRVIQPGSDHRLPSKLVLRKTNKGLKMIAQHSSHSSHASHAIARVSCLHTRISHSSHSSHSSHASRAI